MWRLSKETNFKDESNIIIWKNKKKPHPIILSVIHSKRLVIPCGVHKTKQNIKESLLQFCVFGKRMGDVGSFSVPSKKKRCDEKGFFIQTSKRCFDSQ